MLSATAVLDDEGYETMGQLIMAAAKGEELAIQLLNQSEQFAQIGQNMASGMYGENYNYGNASQYGAYVAANVMNPDVNYEAQNGDAPILNKDFLINNIHMTEGAVDEF